MKKEKGFTLIELLAVIVILAVIALIATPIIMNVINDSKEGSAKDAMYGYVKAVELSTINTVTATHDAPDGVYTTTSGNLVKGTDSLSVNFKGSKPKDNGYIILRDGQVIESGLEFDGYCIKHDGSKAELGDNCIPPKNYNAGDEVYFDPTGAITDCKSGSEWTPTNISTTCYKWNVIKDSGNSVEMLLNHNTTPKIAWATKEDYITAGGTEAEYGGASSNKLGPVTLINKIKEDTATWSKVEIMTSSDSVVRTNGFSGTYTINYNGMGARLISGQEIADIGKDEEWAPNKITKIIYSDSLWLYQNLSGENTDTQPYGYWTDTAYPDNVHGEWRLSHNNFLSHYSAANYSSNMGLRPVVRVLKSNI